jgi:hypothetical protein
MAEPGYTRRRETSSSPTPCLAVTVDCGQHCKREGAPVPVNQLGGPALALLLEHRVWSVLAVLASRILHPSRSVLDISLGSVEMSLNLELAITSSTSEDLLQGAY